MNTNERVKVKGVLPTDRTPFTQELTASTRILEKKPTPDVPQVQQRSVPGEELKVPENRIHKADPIEVGHTVASRETTATPDVPTVTRERSTPPELPSYTRKENSPSPALPEREKPPTGVDVTGGKLFAPEVRTKDLKSPEVPQVDRKILASPALPTISDRMPTGSPELPVIPRPIESTPIVDPLRLNRRSGIMTAQTIWN